MFVKSLFAAAALAAVAAATTPAAQAKVNFDVHVNVPGFGVGPVYVGEDFDDDFDPGCFYKKVKVVKWHNHGGLLHKHIKWKKQLVCG